MSERYRVQSEHCREEPRIYWVEDTTRRYGAGKRFKVATGTTTRKREAQGWCNELNRSAKAAAHTSTNHSGGK